MRPTPSRFHFPCWELTADDGTQYIVWAPGPISHQGHETGTSRNFWAASWNSDDGEAGDYRQGDTLAEVLVILPIQVADAFRSVVEDWQR